MALIDAHPALKAASPQAPVADWFVGDDFHHNGALWLAHRFNFYASFGRPRPAPTKSVHDEGFDHGTPDACKFFLEMGPLANADKKYLKGGIPFWADAMRHPNYDAFWKARTILPHLLVEGPWCHGCWSRGDGDKLGNVSFNSKASQFYRDNIEFPFFNYQLKGTGELKLPGA